MHNIGKRSAGECGWSLNRCVYIYGPITKWQHWGMYWVNKLRIPLNAVRVGMPPALSF